MTFAVLPPSEICRKYSLDIRESKCVVVSSVLHSSVTDESLTNGVTRVLLGVLWAMRFSLDP
jgi:hypothetical protein